MNMPKSIRQSTAECTVGISWKLESRSIQASFSNSPECNDYRGKEDVQNE